MESMKRPRKAAPDPVPPFTFMVTRPMTMTANEIRQSFLDFFISKDHQIVPSSPVVIPADPTLLFANAGMNQFKEVFLGAREPAARRVADTQKCIRVSGKHNDLEEVGHDTYHHTFFEMLGNWSFGDYYKREIITWAWELMTEVWGLPKDRLWATVYRDDAEAETLWKECTDIAHDHILRFGEKDNFWEMGETGPCGPCSEIHIDLTENGCPPELVNAGSPDVIELWNLVFIQYNRQADGTLTELPSKHVDTGMGFERVVAVLQGKKSNYDTDVFTPILNWLSEQSGRSYEGDDAIAMRVIADHIRTLSVAIADGVLPSNEGRGYVLRRLLRRAVRYARNLGLDKPFLAELFPVVEAGLAQTFPELTKQRDLIMRSLKAEEDSFRATLERGLALFEEVADRLKADQQKVFPGVDAFKLYDTYGFPVDLSRLMASECGLELDDKAFETCMEEQRDRARSARDGAQAARDNDTVSALINAGIHSTFDGYRELEQPATVLALLSEGRLVDKLSEGAEGAVILDRTPFYAESGGQVGDTGQLTADGFCFEVSNTQRPAEGLIQHIGRVSKGGLRKGMTLTARVDVERRHHIQRHHTATHLLNWALRTLVDSSIHQAGSYVDDQRMRFDFNCYEALTPQQLSDIEAAVNAKIRENAEVTTSEMALKDVPNSGIIAVFDEKYGETVRVVDVGGYSRELCGGAHVQRSGDLGLFRIVSESSIASGVRRIEAICGAQAWSVMHEEHVLIEGLSRKFSVSPAELEGRIEHLQEENKRMQRELKELASKAALSNLDALLEQQVDVNGVALISAQVGEVAMEPLRELLEALRGKVPSGVLLLGSAPDGKACFAASISDDLVKQGLNAGKLIGQVARIAGGGGGGRPDKAQAGGRDGSKVPEALKAVPELVQALMA